MLESMIHCKRSFIRCRFHKWGWFRKKSSWGAMFASKTPWLTVMTNSVFDRRKYILSLVVIQRMIQYDGLVWYWSNLITFSYVVLANASSLQTLARASSFQSEGRLVQHLSRQFWRDVQLLQVPDSKQVIKLSILSIVCKWQYKDTFLKKAAVLFCSSQTV